MNDLKITETKIKIFSVLISFSILMLIREIVYIETFDIYLFVLFVSFALVLIINSIYIFYYYKKLKK